MKTESYYEEIREAFIGRTVESIDDSCVNAIIFYFTDGTYIQVAAECGTGPTAIPYFDVWEV